VSCSYWTFLSIRRTQRQACKKYLKQGMRKSLALIVAFVYSLSSFSRSRVFSAVVTDFEVTLEGVGTSETRLVDDELDSKPDNNTNNEWERDRYYYKQMVFTFTLFEVKSFFGSCHRLRSDPGRCWNL